MLRFLIRRGSKCRSTVLLLTLSAVLVTLFTLAPSFHSSSWTRDSGTRHPGGHFKHAPLLSRSSPRADDTRKKTEDNEEEDRLWSGILQQLSVPPPIAAKEQPHDPDFIWNHVEGRLKQREMATNCRMSNCFNWTRCQLQGSDVLKIHIYPSEEEFDSRGHSHNMFKTSATYAKILSVIQSSIHYEANASKACLFVPRFDTLSRDSLSPDFVKHLAYHFVPEDEGRNHLMFNLYSGTWPDYHELDFAGFNPGYSMLVKASSSSGNLRPGFDISMPLFDKSHPEKSAAAAASEDFGEEGEEEGSAGLRNRHKGQGGEEDVRRMFDQEPENEERKALLVFKGKRYTNGIGSETRNSLHHLHNGRDVLMYTTCKHGKKWKEAEDERCEQDNAVYDSIDYQKLMENATFCLVPRGRRLASYRFLEALSVGCIPVILSNDWVKPFHEVIDWKQVVVDADERLLFQLPELLRSFDPERIRRMRSLSLAIYETYFSSVQQIVMTTIDIIADRIRSQSAKSTSGWNLVRTGICDSSPTDSAFSSQVSHRRPPHLQSLRVDGESQKS